MYIVSFGVIGTGRMVQDGKYFVLTITRLHDNVVPVRWVPYSVFHYVSLYPVPFSTRATIILHLLVV